MADIFKNAGDIERKFQQHGHAVQRELLNKGVRKGAELVRQRAQDLAPRDEGTLAEQEVATIMGGESSAAEVVARIGPSRATFYGFFQEFGTAFHAKQPFLFPASLDMQEAAIEATNQTILAGLEALQ